MFRSPVNQACDLIAARRPCRRRSRRRGAFTLFEVLLALGLCVVLMVAVYASLDLFARFSTAGQDDMQRSQVSRALLKKMEIDIRSVVYRPVKSPTSGPPPPPGGSDNENQNGNGDGNNSNTGGNNSDSTGNNQGDNNGSDDPDDDNTEPVDVDPADGFLPAATGIVGDAQTLVLNVARPHRKVKLTAVSEETGLPADVGDLKSVSYFLAVRGGTGLPGQVADAFSGEEDDDEQDDVRGLARLEGDRLTIKIADENSDLNQLVDRTKLLAEEVRLLEFSYFDGENWVESWDSVRSKSLPQAIEIQLGFRRVNEYLLKTSRSREPETSLDIYRFVVRIPAAKPYVPLDE